MDLTKSEDFLSLEEILAAQQDIMATGLVGRTPLLKQMQYQFPELSRQQTQLYLKLENTQNTGSFKIRGVVNQITKVSKLAQKDSGIKFVTISAGNYGKAFAYMLHKLDLPGLCIMPDSSQKSKIKTIKSYGVEVQMCPTSELQANVDKNVAENGYHFCHPFDDRDLMAGYASIGLEIVEDLPDLDILLICCGGGGLSSGISVAVRSKLKSSCRIYAVEPEGSPTMFESFKTNKAVTMPTVKSVASGLSPPYTGRRAFRYCREFVDDVILVSDDEILNAMKRLYDIGLVVEPSGSAAMAALLNNHVPDVENKKVAVIISGGNVSVNEINELLSQN